MNGFAYGHSSRTSLRALKRSHGKSGETRKRSGCGVWGGVLEVNFTAKLKSGPKDPKNYSASFCTSNFLISLWEKPETLHFLVFRTYTSGRDHDSQNQLYFTLDHQSTLKSMRKSHNMFEHIILGSLKILEIENFENVGKDADRTILKIRLINS